MPRIELIPEVLYNALNPYHVYYDNLPIKNIIARQDMMNSSIDKNTKQILDAVGSAGTLDNRLSASLEDDGSLLSSAVDASLHSIEAHTDTVEFVRMTNAERDKLALIEDEANFLAIHFDRAGPSETPVPFESGNVVFSDSVSTCWRYEAGKMFLDLAFPLEAAHQHFYDLAPLNPSGDFKNYTVTTLSTPYMSGSLRVYINGSKLSESAEIYIPGRLPTDPFTLNSFTPNPGGGTFVLDAAITSEDVIRVDFETPFLAETVGGCSGLVPPTPGACAAYGELYAQGNTIAQTLETQHIWEVVDALKSAGNYHDTSIDTSSHNITILNTGTYMVDFELSYNGDVSRDFDFAVFLNGSVQNDIRTGSVIFDIYNGDVGNISACGFLSATAFDYIDLRVKCTSDDNKNRANR
jgi:hypothetical protein